MVSAFDYRRFCAQRPGKRNRLLFIAHRAEILEQSLACFRGVLRDENFGDLFVGGYEPQQTDHLFLSIQTFQSRAWHQETTRDHYDFIVVDEFHHAAAPSYQKLLQHYQPEILLGLTATPERMDGKSILPFFANRIAAEIRLPEAIERKLLCPFQYFGVSDSVNLRDLRWTRGGYDPGELNRVYSLDHHVARRRAQLIVDKVHHYVSSLSEVKGLGFCVSVEHARFMAAFFREQGIPSLALTGETADEERRTAQTRLKQGNLHFLFVVDIYNEGVDIPEVNTILFLRPTESLTVFIQQLGRGLRLAENKDMLTVLDFIGQANRNYSFEAKFDLLAGQAGRAVEREIRQGFPHLPRGCAIELERKAREHVLESIRSGFQRQANLVERLARFVEDVGSPLTLARFLDHHHLDARTFYRHRKTFARLTVQAGIRDDFREESEAVVSKALPRLLDIDSEGWIRFLLSVLPLLATGLPPDLSPLEIRWLQMFCATVWRVSAKDLQAEEVWARLQTLAADRVMLKEVLDILRLNLDCLDLVSGPSCEAPDLPFDLHRHYSLFEIASALGYFNFDALRGVGVKYFPERKTDVLFVTLNKSEKEYSPTTMYEDYAINESLFHWQSQSTTAAESPTGQRYIHHRKQGSKILLFVRGSKRNRYGFTNPYTFLGACQYVSHEGSRPMSIVWRLEKVIPAKYLKETSHPEAL